MRTNSLGLLLTMLVGCGGSSNGMNTNVDAPPATEQDAAPDSPPPSDMAMPSSDPAEMGPNTFTSSTTTIPGALANRTLSSTVVVPDGAGPHPLAIISPGFQMARTQYTSYAEHLASWGFVVVLTDYGESGFSLDHQRIANDIPKVVDWALAQTTFEIDDTKIAALGHSLGGKLSLLAASAEPRIKAIVAWDPVDSVPSVAPEKMTALTAPTAVIGETLDVTGQFMACAPAADNFTQFYAAIPAGTPALQATVLGADHMDWVDDPTCLLCGFCQDGPTAAEVTRTATRRLDVAWLRKHLFADASMDAWLVGTAQVEVVSR